MTWLVYEMVFWIGLVLVSPYYLWRMRRRGGYATGFLERFGMFSPEQRIRLEGLRPVWIHAVSVGEVEIALEVIARLRAAPSPPPLLLSTTTSTGHALAAGKLPADVPLVYYPLDSILCFGRAHATIRPRALVLVEAELWPNHLRFCAERGIPVALLNARLSRRCEPRYRRFGWLFRPAFRAFRLATLQSPGDVARLEALGFPPPSLHVVGSLKYDTAAGSDPERRGRLLDALSFLGDRPAWVAGSTHAGEEEIVLDIFQRLRTSHPGLALVLAPRHVERTTEVAALIRQRGLSFVLRSEITPPHTPALDTEVVLLNTTGELKYLYERATVIFMGKSLTGHGGQNIIEPAILGKPVLFGPHMENFPVIAADFIEGGAAIQVADATALERHVDELLRDPSRRDALGKKALEVIARKRGAMERTLGELRGILGG